MPSEDPWFARLYEAYPRCELKHSARKAFGATKQLHPRLDFDRLLLAVEVYVARTEPKYYKELGNWLREDVWLDYYETENIRAVVERLRAIGNEAQLLVDTWVKEALRHWIKPIDREGKVAIARLALRDRFFNGNWCRAFEAAQYVFRKRFAPDDYRSNIKVSVEWFCREGVAAKILEGHYGRTTKFVPRQRKVSNGISNRLVDSAPPPEVVDPETFQKGIDEFMQKCVGEVPPNPFEEPPAGPP